MNSTEIEHIFRLMDLDTPEKREIILSKKTNPDENKYEQQYIIATSGNTENVKIMECEDA